MNGKDMQPVRKRLTADEAKSKLRNDLCAEIDQRFNRQIKLVARIAEMKRLIAVAPLEVLVLLAAILEKSGDPASEEIPIELAQALGLPIDENSSGPDDGD